MTATRPIETATGPLIQPLPFSRAEYDRRHAGVRRAMAAAGLDAFVSFGPENINWLTGHDTPAYHYVQAAVVTPGEDPVTLLRGIEVTNTLSRTWSRRAVGYADHEEPMEVLADLLDDLAGPAARIGVEADGFFVSPRRFDALRRRLGDRLVAAQPVEALRLVKSEEELAHIRAAAAITGAAMGVAIAAAGEGVNENAIAGAVLQALASRGGEFPGLPPFIVAGPRTSLGHATWAGRVLQRGDPLAFEIPGVVHRYVAPLFRSGSVGEPDRDRRRLEAAVLDSLDLLIAGIAPGAIPEDLHAASAARFRRHGFEVGHRSGYSVGVNYAPDWGEGNLLSIQPGERRPLQAGMVFHLVPGIYVPGRHAIVISETVAVTERGCEVLTEAPRGLFVV